MYEAYYHFKEKPFNLTPDPKFLYFSKQHQGALDHMLYGIREREGFIVIFGGIGTGKTTLCRCLLNKLESDIQVALILNPTLSDMDLLRALIHDLGVPAPVDEPEFVVPRRIDDDSEEIQQVPKPSPKPNRKWINSASKSELLDALNQFLLEQHARGGSTVVIIDEAQNLAMDVMEQVRLLSNLETEKEKLLQIIFVGHKELDEKLKLPELKQLRQRISIQYELKPLTREETRNYIDHRILVARGNSRICFSKSGLNEVYNYSKGYPRLINLVCDRALLAGYNEQVEVIEGKHVRHGIRSLLGEEEQGFFLKRLFAERLPLALSILFFMAGLAFFFIGGKGGWPRVQKMISDFTVTAPVNLQLTAPAPETIAENKFVEEPEVDKAPVPEQKISDPEPPAPESSEISNVSSKETPVPAALEAKANKEFFRIQVYSSKMREEAMEKLKELHNQGFEAFLKEVRSTGKPWFVVYAGPYSKRDTARNNLKILKQSGYSPILLSINRAG